MKSANQPVYVLGSARTPFVKSQTGYADVSRKDLMVAALEKLRPVGRDEAGADFHLYGRGYGDRGDHGVGLTYPFGCRLRL